MEKGEYMIEVNIEALKNSLSELSGVIDEFEEIELNIFNQLSQSTTYWKDTKSIEFEEKIEMEKRESSTFLVFVKNEKNIYQYIIDKYSSIGNKIKCNLNNKDKIIKSITDCISNINNVDIQFDEIEYCDEYYWIMSQRDKLRNAKQVLEEYENQITEMFDKIQEIENNIESKMKSIPSIKISAFDFEL